MPLRVNGYAVDKIRYNGAIITSKPQRLASCDIDIDTGIIIYTLEGDSNNYKITFEIEDDTITYTWPDNFVCRITVTGDVPEDEEEEEQI